MAIASNLGFCDFPQQPEAARAIANFREGRLDAAGLRDTLQLIRRQNWKLQNDQGIRHIPSNDCSLGDALLDMRAVLGAAPDDFTIASYFDHAGQRCRFGEDQQFDLVWRKPVEEFRQAKEMGFHTRPVLLGPVSLLTACGASPRLLDRLLPAYAQLLRALADSRADWVQIDEPALAGLHGDDWLSRLQPGYEILADAAPELHLLLNPGPGSVARNMAAALAATEVLAGLHLDLVADPAQLDAALSGFPARRSLSLGVLDVDAPGRADLAALLPPLEEAASRLGSQFLLVAPNKSMAHLPLPVDRRPLPEPASTAHPIKEKLAEISILAKAIREGRQSVAAELRDSRAA